MLSEAVFTRWKDVLGLGVCTWLEFLIKFAAAPVLKVLAITSINLGHGIETLLGLARVLQEAAASLYIMTYTRKYR